RLALRPVLARSTGNDLNPNLQSLSNSYYDAATNVSCYLDDMQTELQMLLLSDLFPNVIPRRRPADPSRKVLSLEPSAVKILRQHFLENTPWGKKTVAIQFDVDHDFQGRA
ncbi:hypothetical protein, partial [Accumulibacter sp.]|uniref:hypothetical protein n=1 Tax=Accumulibacter sp. TaxID=2053492 RepID=UPI0026162EAB